MTKEKKTQKLGQNFRPVDIAEWYAWCEQYAHCKTDATVAAWALFMLIPASLRNLAILGEWDLVRECLRQATESLEAGLTGTAEGARKNLAAIRRKDPKQERRDTRSKNGEAS